MKSKNNLEANKKLKSKRRLEAQNNNQVAKNHNQEVKKNDQLQIIKLF